jgi:nucleoside-diphosphate-sugar epimerase
VPPAKGSDGDPRLERYLESLESMPRRLIYLSTTGVYGDRAGAVVNEDTPTAPITARAARRVAAERTLRAWADARRVSWCILRVPGIYGPGRLPLERLRRGEPAVVPREATPGNRIHVADLVTACVAAGVAAAADGRIYNVTDGSEDSLTEYLLRVAEIAKLPAPPLVSRAHAERALSETSWSFLAESRRVDNRRMLDELGVALEFHDLDAGIRASLGETQA